MTTNEAPIEPIRKTRRVSLAPAAAFDLFTSRMLEWWPVANHSIAGEDVVELRFEGRVGGQLIEVARDGTEHAWADVLAWEPPYRLSLSWHPTPEPTAASIVEVRFTPDGGGSLLELDHRGWEAFGRDAGTRLHANYEPGWDGVLGAYERLASGA